MQHKLKIGLLIDELNVPAWQHALLMDLAHSDFAFIGARIEIAAKPAKGLTQGWAFSLCKAFQRYERKNAVAHDACGIVNAGELLDGVETADAAKKLVGQAKRLKDEDIELALVPFSKCKGLDADQIIRRADVLELARHWVTRAIKVAVKKPLWLHILRREDWKLY